jgi:hypothetical protein
MCMRVLRFWRSTKFVEVSFTFGFPHIGIVRQLMSVPRFLCTV